MRPRAFAPDSFAIAMLLLGAVLMVFPSLRVARVIALGLAFAYWLLMVVLKSARR